MFRLRRRHGFKYNLNKGPNKVSHISEDISDTTSDTSSDTSSGHGSQNCDEYYCDDNDVDVCQCQMMCDTQTQEQIKYQTLKHSCNYIGISKKMAYGQYIRMTPGMETFASKKIPVLQPLVQAKIQCFSTYWCQHL